MLLKKFNKIKDMNLKVFYFLWNDNKYLYQVKIDWDIFHIFSLYKNNLSATWLIDTLKDRMIELWFQEEGIISRIKYFFYSNDKKDEIDKKDKLWKDLYQLLVSDKELRKMRNKVFKVLMSENINNITEKYISKLLKAKTEYKIYSFFNNEDLEKFYNITKKKKRQFLVYYWTRKIHHIKMLIDNNDKKLSYFIEKWPYKDNYNLFILYDKSRIILNHMRKKDLSEIFGDAKKRLVCI